MAAVTGAQRQGLPGILGVLNTSKIFFDKPNYG